MTLLIWPMVCFIKDIKPIMGTPKGLEVCMKNGLLRFYLLFMVMSLGLFSCENHEMSKSWGTTGNELQRKPESRHPNELNDNPVESQKNEKKPRRNFNAKSSNWC